MVIALPLPQLVFGGCRTAHPGVGRAHQVQRRLSRASAPCPSLAWLMVGHNADALRLPGTARRLPSPAFGLLSSELKPP
ncbi:hypothetical protein MTO96_046241 [Rhipicephalus appendiculatus]